MNKNQLIAHTTIPAAMLVMGIIIGATAIEIGCSGSISPLLAGLLLAFLAMNSLLSAAGVYLSTLAISRARGEIEWLIDDPSAEIKLLPPQEYGWAEEA